MTNKENKENTTTSTPTSPVKPKMKNTSITIKKNTEHKKKMNQMSTYILDTDYETNTNTIIKYYEEFDFKQIESLLEEAYANVKYNEEENLGFFSTEMEFISYIMWLISVRFTNLSKDVPTTLPEQIPIFLDMVSTGLLSRIHEEVLDSSEVYKIIDKLNQFTEIAARIADLEESTRNEILSTVQNKEILNYGKSKNKSDVIHPLNNPDSKLLQ